MYRTILVGNDEYRKTMHRCKTVETAYLNYHRIREANESVVFPRKHINDGKIKPAKYEIFLVKDIEEGDTHRYRRDELGRVYEEKPIFDYWTVIESSKYEVEESFYLYGHNPKTDRMTVHDIARLVMNEAKDMRTSRQVIVVHNKLVIHNESRFDMVICKNKKDCQRLHHFLNREAKSFKLKGLVFMGTCSDSNIPLLYEIIHENTGWAYRKIRRTTTRP